MSNVREILERALASGEVTLGFLDRANLYERAIKEALAALDAEGVGGHIEAITQAIRDDEGYAISWHANLAMAYQDEGGDHATANRAAARFMQQLFGVDTSSAIPLPGQSPEPSAGLREALEWYAEQARDCRKMGRDGDRARQALDADGGARALAALRSDEEQSDG